MKLLIFVLFITVALKFTKQFRNTEATLGVQDRVAILKHQIAKEIKKKRDEFRNDEKLQPIHIHDESADYEYVDRHEEPITPIMEYDERKKAHKFKLRELRTTKQNTQGHTKKRINKKEREDKRNKEPLIDLQDDNREAKSTSNEKTDLEHNFNNFLKIINQKTFEPTTSDYINKDAIGQLKLNPARSATNTKKHNMAHKRKPKVSKVTDNVFYRRQIVLTVEDTNNLRREFVHCQDLISPFLKAQKTNLTVTKRLTVRSNLVLRLVQLLSEDTSDDTREDVYSILYQISNIQIRLFQWDVTALQLLFNVLNKENIKRHTFRTIKQGVKKTLDSWKLDISNTTNLLQQARLFRPPCVRMFGYEGSTKTSMGLRISKPQTTKCSQENLDMCDY